MLATERCLDVYTTERLENSIARKMERQNNILKPYAQVYWPVHYKHIEDSNTAESEKRELRYTGKIDGKSLPYVQWMLDILKPYPEVHRSVYYKHSEDFEASPLRSKISRFTAAHMESHPHMYSGYRTFVLFMSFLRVSGP